MSEGTMSGPIETVVLALFGAVVGLFILGLGIAFIPRMLARLTPHLDEEQEILRGNQAVGIYFGLLTAAVILGMSIIISVALFSALHV
jgi:uncharacterized protein YqgC (DUF456 family)